MPSNDNAPTVNKLPARWTAVRARAIDLAIPPALAAMFWGLMILMIIFATAEGKDSPMTAFFTAFGAVGQVAIAWMVWRLSREQFHFTKLLEAKQERLDLSDRRFKFNADYIEWSRKHIEPTMSDTDLKGLLQLSMASKIIFPRNVSDALEELMKEYIEHWKAQQISFYAKEKGEIMIVVETMRELNRLFAAISVLDAKVQFSLGLSMNAPAPVVVD